MKTKSLVMVLMMIAFSNGIKAQFGGFQEEFKKRMEEEKRTHAIENAVMNAKGTIIYGGTTTRYVAPKPVHRDSQGNTYSSAKAAAKASAKYEKKQRVQQEKQELLQNAHGMEINPTKTLEYNDMGLGATKNLEYKMIGQASFNSLTEGRLKEMKDALNFMPKDFEIGFPKSFDNFGAEEEKELIDEYFAAVGSNLSAAIEELKPINPLFAFAASSLLKVEVEVGKAANHNKPLDATFWRNTMTVAVINGVSSLAGKQLEPLIGSEKLGKAVTKITLVAADDVGQGKSARNIATNVAIGVGSDGIGVAAGYISPNTPTITDREVYGETAKSIIKNDGYAYKTVSEHVAKKLFLNTDIDKNKEQKQ